MKQFYFLVKKCFVCIFLLYAGIVYSQDSLFDKQLKEILIIKPTQKRIDTLEKFAKFIVFNDYVTGRKASAELIKLTHNLKDSKQLLTAYNIIGLACYYSGENNVALAYYDTLVKLSIKRKDTLMEAKAHGNSGLIYEREGNFKTAFSEYTKALKCAELLKSMSLKASSLGNLGNVSIRLDQFNQAIIYLEKSAMVFDELGNKKAVGNQYNSISQAYNGLKNKEKEVEYLKRAEAIYRSISEKRALGTVLINLGSIENDAHHYKEAVKIFEEALKIKKETGDDNGVATILINITVSYAQFGKFDKAIKAINEAEQIAANQNDLFTRSKVLEKKSMIYRMSGDYRKAYDYYDAYIKVKDTILGEETHKAIAEYKEKYESEKKQFEIDELRKNEEIDKLKIKQNEEQLEKEKAHRYLIFGVLLCVVILCGIMIWAFIQKRKNSRALELKNELINAKNLALEEANSEISEQKEIIEEKQKEIIDSIHYAKRIQNTLLAHKDFMDENIPSNFVLFKPKDIVSGDFYWAARHEHLFYLAVCDSTGHGVPGAFMSLLNIGFLSEAINEKNILEPHHVLDYVRKRLISSVSKDGQKDGFDGILLCMNQKTNELTYAAAHNAPLLITHNQIQELKKDKMPVGDGGSMENFSLHRINMKKEDTLYLYTDGYADQFGGPKGKKFKYKPLNELLLSISEKPLNDQAQILDQHFADWRGNLEQVDDVCIIGIRI